MALLQNAQQPQQPDVPFKDEDMQLAKQAKSVADEYMLNDNAVSALMKQADAGMLSRSLATGVNMVLDKVEETVGRMPESVLLAVMIGSIGDIVEIAQGTGRQVEPEDVTSALQISVSEWIKKHQDRVSPDQVREAMMAMDQMAGQQAEANGELPPNPVT